MRKILFSLLALLAAACGGARTTLSLQDITCQSCGAQSVGVLQKTPGIKTVSFERDAVELVIEYDPEVINPEGLVAVVKAAGYAAVVGAGQGRYAHSSPFPKAADVALISKNGETIELTENLAIGKFTVFDFYAPWCGPCKKVDAEMARILGHRSDVALRKINIDTWSTPVVQQFKGQLNELPYVVVFGPDGKQIAAISGLDLPRLRKALSEAPR